MPAKHGHRYKQGQVWSPRLRGQIRAGIIASGFFTPPREDWDDALRVIALRNKPSFPGRLAHPFGSSIGDLPFVRGRDKTQEVYMDLRAYGQAAERTTRFPFSQVYQQDVDSRRVRVHRPTVSFAAARTSSRRHGALAREAVRCPHSLAHKSAESCFPISGQKRTSI